MADGVLLTDKILAAAHETFRQDGYGNGTLESVARRAKVELGVVQGAFPDKSALLAALIRKHNPADDLIAVMDGVKGESAEDIFRDAMRGMLRVIEQHEVFIDLTLLDPQIAQNELLNPVMDKVTPHAIALFRRLKETGELRPVSDPILIRTLLAMLIGYVASERVAPQVARMAMRVFPQRAWIDGMVDLILYGILEDHN